MTSPAILSAYKNARASGGFHYQEGTGFYDSRFQGPRRSSDALAHARAALTREADALALSDAAREAVAALRAAREAGADGFNPSDLAAAENVAKNAGRAVENAREAVRARPFPLNRSPYPTAGTWQRPDADSYGRKRSGRFWFWHGVGGALRNVADSSDILARHERNGRDGGFCCDPDGETFRDGTGLVFGVVAQLRAKDGRARFVPGSRFGGQDDAGTFDLSDVYTADGSDDDAAQEARKDAARAANELARLAAEQESAYQEAWRAGSSWANAGETIENARRAALALLAERRAARTLSPAAFPVLCGVIREKVADLLESIADARKARADLADSIYGESHRSAFCEGANLSAFPS